MTTNDLADPVPWGFDHADHAHRLMIRAWSVHHALSGEPGSQITLRPGHHPEAAHHIVIYFTSTAVDLAVDRREIMLHVDPLADDLRSGHYNLQ